MNIVQGPVLLNFLRPWFTNVRNNLVRRPEPTRLMYLLGAPL
jgi:hypothetical protein